MDHTHEANGGGEPRKQPFKVIYAIVERPNGKPFWMRVGTAFPNRDGSMNLYLDAVPLGGKLQMRDFVLHEERGREGAGPEDARAQGVTTRAAS